jgi:ubiquinone/menaquinone biosynthesis C-methylase UbiE
MNFKDHFSKQAADYAIFRPSYPQELFAYLGSIAPSRGLAWDCGTGNGQAAVGLTSVFDRVIATDASAKQIANAHPHKRVDYRVARAEESGLESANVDLILIAQALHWFDLDRFYAEARRVLKPDGAPRRVGVPLCADRASHRCGGKSILLGGGRAFLATGAQAR